MTKMYENDWRMGRIIDKQSLVIGDYGRRTTLQQPLLYSTRPKWVQNGSIWEESPPDTQWLLAIVLTGISLACHTVKRSGGPRRWLGFHLPQLREVGYFMILTVVRSTKYWSTKYRWYCTAYCMTIHE